MNLFFIWVHCVALVLHEKYSIDFQYEFENLLFIVINVCEGYFGDIWIKIHHIGEPEEHVTDWLV